MQNIVSIVSQKLDIPVNKINATLDLLSNDNTISYIARYRKDTTGNLDEEQIRKIEEIYRYQNNLAERKENVIKLISEKGKITPEIIKAINDCERISEVDEIYKPYKESRKTRATEAIRNGLKPLSDLILLQDSTDIKEVAKQYINDELKTAEDCINGAKDIIAEIIAQALEARQ